MRSYFAVLLVTLCYVATKGLSISPIRGLTHKYDFLSDTKVATLENRCCARQTKQLQIGYGIDGEALFVDVGQCRKTCSKKTKIHRKEFEALLKRNSSVDPIELFLSMQRDMAPSSCGEETTCEATRTRMERHMTMSGLQQVAVLEDCQCTAQPSACQRTPNFVIYFPGTPFEKTIDVGACQGSCSSELGCRPVRNRTVAISGPNGDECVSVTEECGCQTSCYRMTQFEHVYDYSEITDNVDLGNDAEDDTEDRKPQLKIVDVGHCVGVCDGIHRKHHCVLRDSENQSRCLMSLARQEHNCGPVAFELERYKAQDGEVKNLMAITECGCQ